MEIKEKIKNLIDTNEVCLFMKGTPESPQCGFSMAVSNVLKHLNVNFKGVNVLEDENLRQGIKDFSDWPTIPQLYVKKEFVGGCDIVKEMFEIGELKKLFDEFTVGKQISQINEKVNYFTSSDGRKQMITSLKEEIKKANEKENYLDEDERVLIRDFILKIRKE